MRLCFVLSAVRRRVPAAPDAAFTLPELLIALVVLLLLLTGIIYGNLFGLRIFRLTETKLTAEDAARKALGPMTEEIRACKTTWVGSVSNGVFLGRLDGEPQTGNGLLIYPTTNTASFILYFVNPADQSFRRTTSAPASTTVLAQSVTNAVVFRAQDCLGNLLTNNQNNRVIHVCLEFFQPQACLPVADYYKLETSMTRRTLE
jgi:prepilin-type N-terminal cleavage/methylation domain-containing protein